MSGGGGGGEGGGGEGGEGNETKRTIVTCVVSLGFFACGSIFGAHRVNRNQRRRQQEQLVTTIPSIFQQSGIPTTTEPSSSTSTATATSTSTSTKSSTSSTLDCPVCLSDLIIPRMAPCGHTICTPCLKTLFENHRRPQCPVCRRRMRQPIDKLPINFLVRSCVEERVAGRGRSAILEYRQAEQAACSPTPRPPPPATGHEEGVGNGGTVGTGLVVRLRPALNWFKWSVIIVTEFGAFLVSLKELVDAGTGSTRVRRYQRIV